VFFIRHNGGSVWVNELGWPWPKHACFDKPGEPTHRFTLNSVKALRLHQPRLGIIRRISGNATYDEPLIEIQLTDSSRITLVLRSTPFDLGLEGSLVVISETDRLLIHQQHGEISFHSLSHIAPAEATPPPKEDSAKPPSAPQQLPKWKRRVFERSRLPIQATRRATSPDPKPEVPSAPPPPPPLAPHNLDAWISEATDFVAHKAWAAVADVRPAEEQYRRAKHKALELVSRLSPHIKRQVGNAFTSAKWQPLLARRPKG
jgi:hypothetical protein